MSSSRHPLEQRVSEASHAAAWAIGHAMAGMARLGVDCGQYVTGGSRHRREPPYWMMSNAPDMPAGKWSGTMHPYPMSVDDPNV